MNSTSFGVLNNFIATFLNSINAGYSAINPEVQWITGVFIVILVTMTGLFSALGDDGFPGFIRIFVRKIIEIGFVLLLISKWQYLTDVIGYSLAGLGLKAAGSSQNITAFVQDPLTIVQDGYNLFVSLMQTANNIPTGITGFNHFPEVLGFGLSAIVIMVAFIVIAAEVFMTFVEFKIINLAVLIFVPFSLLKPTAHLSHGAYNSAFKFGAKFLVMAFIVSIGMDFVGQFTVNPAPDWDNLVSIATFSIMFLLLATKLPNLAAGLISGSPNLSGGSAFGAVAGMAAGAAGGVAVKAMTGPRDNSGGGGGGAGSGGAGTNSGLEQMRRAATVGGGPGANDTTLANITKAANVMGRQNDQNPSSSEQG